jgi:hypothetical protein
MKWQAPVGGGDFQRPDPGTYLARCVRLIDLGTQTDEYQGQVSAKRKVLIGWELPTELIPNGDFAGQPYLMTKFYRQSLHEKSNLRHDLTNWRGRDFTETELAGFDPRKILGVPCLVTVTASENGRVNVTGVTAPPRGTTVPEQINESLYFSLEDGEFDRTIFDGLSEGIQKMIRESPEFKERTNGHRHDANGYPQDPDGAPDYSDVDFGNNDIPF